MVCAERLAAKRAADTQNKAAIFLMGMVATVVVEFLRQMVFNKTVGRQV